MRSQDELKDYLKKKYPGMEVIRMDDFHNGNTHIDVCWAIYSQGELICGYTDVTDSYVFGSITGTNVFITISLDKDYNLNSLEYRNHDTYYRRKDRKIDFAFEASHLLLSKGSISSVPVFFSRIRTLEPKLKVRSYKEFGGGDTFCLLAHPNPIEGQVSSELVCYAGPVSGLAEVSEKECHPFIHYLLDPGTTDEVFEFLFREYVSFSFFNHRIMYTHIHPLPPHEFGETSSCDKALNQARLIFSYVGVGVSQVIWGHNYRLAAKAGVLELTDPKGSPWGYIYLKILGPLLCGGLSENKMRIVAKVLLERVMTLEQLLINFGGSFYGKF